MLRHFFLFPKIQGKQNQLKNDFEALKKLFFAFFDRRLLILRIVTEFFQQSKNCETAGFFFVALVGFSSNHD